MLAYLYADYTDQPYTHMADLIQCDLYLTADIVNCADNFG